jgi:CheY-like chemotaxis protein
MAEAPVRALLVDGDEDESVEPAKILIAEDSPDNRLLVQAFSKSRPYQLTFECDGKAAVDRFAASDFDLILMDIGMPVLDGLAATRAIRALERERGADSIPIVALTANAGSADIQASADAGCDAHFSKPISKTELFNAIEKYRRRRKPPKTAPCASSVPIGIEMPPGLEDLVPGSLATRKKEVIEMKALLAGANSGKYIVYSSRNLL